mmetsp:Transcript_2826/g.7930  ORF Transcript_2826/g.7930 Transcript_2826/m.7930 type:complete len:300 (-) Transcript_2826:285-1184(-)
MGGAGAADCQGPSCGSGLLDDDMANELASDPALLDCCLRDAQENRKAAELLGRLKAVDISRKRPDAQASVFPQMPLSQNSAKSESSLESDGEDEDPALQQLREARLREMQSTAQQRAALHTSGFGRLLTLSERSASDRVASESGHVVVHLPVSGLQLCQELNEHLEFLAAQHTGTLFIHINSTVKPGAVLDWGVTTAPALLCFYDGATIGKAAVLQFCFEGDELHEEEVTSWLAKLQALRGPRQELHQLEAQCSSDSDCDDDGGQHPPCPDCGRTYPHEHVRAVYAAERSDSEGEEDDG